MRSFCVVALVSMILPARGAEPPAWELSQVSRDAAAIIGFRPAELAKIPGMKAELENIQKRWMNEAIRKTTGSLFDLPWIDVEQFVGSVVREKADAPDDANLVFKPALLRMTKDVDWRGRIRALEGIAKITETAPGAFRILSEDYWLEDEQVVRVDLFIRVLDARTVSFVPVEQATGPHPDHVAIAGRLRSSAILQLYDKWGIQSMASLSDTPGVSALLTGARRIAVGIDATETCGGTLLCEVEQEAHAPVVVAGFKVLGAWGRQGKGFLADPTQAGDSPQVKLLAEMFRQLCEEKPICADGRIVSCHATSGVKFIEVFRQIGPGPFQRHPAATEKGEPSAPPPPPPEYKPGR